MQTMRKHFWFVVLVSCAFIFWLYLVTSNISHIEHSNPQLIYNDDLLNLSNFKFVMNNASLCLLEDKQSSIAVVVHIARYNFDQRYAIRNTWGSVKIHRQWHFHLIFLLGSAPQNNEKDIRLLEENSENGDMIMENFIDTYRNLTYKHLMGYKWVSMFCPSAKFVLKTDDDVFINVFRVVENLLPQLQNSKKTYACLNCRSCKPMRDPSAKWYVSKELYANSVYPGYCSGSAYLMKAHDAAKIYSASNNTKLIWIDDIFVTGILRAKSGLRLHSLATNDYHLGDKREIITWCKSDSSESLLKHIFILLNKNQLICDMFCIWNKVRLIAFGKNNTIVSVPSNVQC